MPSLPGWDGFALRDHFAERTSIPVTLENDGIAAAYGEWQYGAGRGLQHLVCVAVGTGIGGGVIVDGRVLRGRRGMASHVGHFQMAADGPQCSCGAVGCFEALASGKALVRNARAGLATNPQSRLAQLAPAEIDGTVILAAAQTGDPFACRLLDQEADYLGRGFASLAHLYSPDRIVMGGGVSKAFEFMEQKIWAAANERFMTAFDEIEIKVAELGEDAALIGAAAQAIDAID